MKNQNKRQRLLDETVPTKRRRVRGALRSLPDMPVDIICQIFYLLHPVDLLRIARTNKAFRKLLIVRNTSCGSEYACTSIWREARKNVQDLPEPFPGMSEPFYASLCFEPHCTICFKQSIHDIIWEFRARLCNECRKTRTSLAFRMEVQIGSSPVALSLMNAQVITSGRARKAFLVSDVTQLEEKWKSLEDDGEKEKFVRSHEENIQVLEDHVRRCSRWFCSRKTDRLLEIWRIKGQRCKNILDRLEELGYGPDTRWANRNYIIRKHRIEMLPVVRQGNPLTERIWQKIRPEIVNHILTHIRPKRLQTDYKSVLEDRIPLLKVARADFAEPYGTIFPLVEDFARLPEVKAILDPSDGKHVTIESFETLRPQIPDILARWKETIRDELDTFLKKELINIPPDLPVWDSNLAIAALSCTRCHQIVQTSNLELAVHECQPRPWPLTVTGDSYEQSLRSLELYPYSLTDFYVAEGEALKIIQACGKDRLITMQELDALNPQLTCITCSDALKTCITYGWRDALSHSITVHLISFESNGSALWAPITPGEERGLLSREEDRYLPQPLPFSQWKFDPYQFVPFILHYPDIGIPANQEVQVVAPRTQC